MYARGLRSCSRALRAPATLVRGFAKKAEKEGVGAMSSQDITKYFLDFDSATPAAQGLDLPIKLTGRSGQLVTELYQKGKNFDKILKELEAFVAAVHQAGMVVDRFFATANYSPEECQLVIETLTSNKEPLTSFESIKNADVKDMLVDNESNLDTWRAARKAIAAANLSPEVKAVLDSLASEARLDLVKLVASKAADLRSVTSKTLDASVTSASPLSKETQSAIAKALPAYAPSGYSLNINYTVDPAVLGGLLVTLKNQTIDLTVTSKLVDVMAAKLA